MRTTCAGVREGNCVEHPPCFASPPTRYEVPFRLALKSGAVDYSTCLVGTACGYHHEEWEERLAISELRCLHTVHSMMCYVLFLGVSGQQRFLLQLSTGKSGRQ